MANNAPDYRYFGYSKFSSVPDGLISHIAPSPGPLCPRCSQLDYPGFFASESQPAEEQELLQDADHLLGAYDEISRKAFNCEFCQLVIEALVNSTHGLIEKETIWTSKLQHANVYLNRSSAGSYYYGAPLPVDETVPDGDKVSGSPHAETRIERNQVDGNQGDDGKINVGCIIVYTDIDYPPDVHVRRQDRGYIRLLANDAHLLGQEPMYHGRVVGNHISPDLLRTWIMTCNDSHSLCKTIKHEWGLEHLTGPRSLRYVDTINMCLRWRHWYDLAEHVALSYVWGGSQGLQLLKSNQKQLFVKGALKNTWDNIPAVIRDAIELVRDLNSENEEKKIYLWVDQLCIIQDDPTDKATQVQQMNQTYFRSIGTLIAAEGSHSNLPLSRHNCHSFSPQHTHQRDSASGQMIKNIQGLRLLAALPGSADSLSNSKWSTRAWTLQESVLSHASIEFGKNQVIFRCASEVFREDFVAEVTKEGFGDMNSTGRKWTNSQAWERRVVPTEDRDWPMTFNMYAELVEGYTGRAMTYPTDILPAFQGISQVFHAIAGWKVLNGLIEDVIDFSLLWRPNGEIKRRFSQNGDPNQPGHDNLHMRLPTYSWCAWLGPMTYMPQSFDIKTFIKRFDVVGPKNQKRKLVRFSQNRDEIFEPTNLEPGAGYAPHDCSNFQDMTQTAYYFKPQVQNLAYRMHLSKNPHKQNVDGPRVLQFTTKCVKLLLGMAYPNIHTSNESQGCKSVWLLDNRQRQIGAVWHVPELDEYNNREVEVIMLSRNKSASEAADGWHFDLSAHTWSEWCLCNVLLIKRLPSNSLCERLTIGKVHETCLESSWDELVRLV
ncbi:MAG: hypothetical protein Q9220_006005 [cf. Caloplaca sp. 1 TL-2023]